MTTPNEPEALNEQYPDAYRLMLGFYCDRDYYNSSPSCRPADNVLMAIQYALTHATPAARMPAGEVAQDLRSALSEALFKLSDRLRASDWIQGRDNHAAYEAVVNAFTALAQPAENAKGGEVVAWASPGQMAAMGDPISEEAGAYIPLRKTSAGKFTMPLYAHPPAAEPVGLWEAAQAVIDGKFSTYKARNGRDVGIQGDDGEKVWLVHSDEIFALETALSHPAPANLTGTRGGGIRSAIAGLLNDELPIAGETYDAEGRAELQSAIMDLVDSLIWREAPVSFACDGIADDYMTSEAHHPGYVLIPTAKFDQIATALATPARTDDAGLLRKELDAIVDAASAVLWRYSNRPDEINDRALWEPLAVLIGRNIASRVPDSISSHAGNGGTFDPLAQPSGDVAAMREAAAKVIDDAVGLIGPKMQRDLAATIRAIPLPPADPLPIIEGDADHWMLAQEVEPAAEEKAGVGESPASVRERVAGIIEDCLARHGVDLDKCEGTLDDADEVIASLSPAAHADVREGLQRAMGIIEKLGGQYDPNGLKFEALSEARAALFDVYSGRPFRSTPPAGCSQ